MRGLRHGVGARGESRGPGSGTSGGARPSGRRAPAAAAALALLFLCGCAAAAKRVGRDSIAYNVSLAQAQNEMLLLNIARASRKHPLYFSTVPSVTEAYSGKAALGLSVPFGQGTTAPYTASPSLEVSGGPSSAQVAALDTEKFQRGLMKPIDMDLFQYLWNQGWNREMLLLLFVRRVFVGDKEYVGALDLHPPAPAQPLDDWNEYRGLVRILASYKFLEAKEVNGDDVGVAFPMGKVGAEELKAIAGAVKEGLTFGEDEKTHVLKVYGKGEKRWAFKEPEWPAREAREGEPGSRAGLKRDYQPDYYDGLRWEAADKQKFTDAYQWLRSAMGRKEPARGLADEAADLPEVGFQTVEPRQSPPQKIRLYLRSPEAVIYALGQLARAELDGERGLPIALTTRTGARRKVLFSVRPGPCPTCGVSVAYCGQTLALDGDTSQDESMHVLSLLSQVFNLQKSAEDLPKSGVVTLVGR